METAQVRLIDAENALDCLKVQDGEDVERWARANDLVIDGDFEFHRQDEYLALARVFIAQKRFEKARSLVERVYRIAQEIGKRQTELEGLILLACIFSVQGETDQALVHLEKALSMGEPEGYVRIFVDEGPPMARLLYKAVTRGIAGRGTSAGYARRLLAAFPVAEPAQADPSETRASSSSASKATASQAALVEPLSEREREVLQLIAEGLINPEIAARLYLSLNTVKAHTRNIYGKLGVHSRVKAVARARALGVLSST